jgi:hypothetical protein
MNRRESQKFFADFIVRRRMAVALRETEPPRRACEKIDAIDRAPRVMGCDV